jgi:hypothetical protein
VTDPFPLFDVPKQCACGNQWVGKSLKPVGAGETLPRGGICEQCIAKEEARAAEAQVAQRRPTRPSDVTLEPPRRVRKDWE